MKYEHLLGRDYETAKVDCYSILRDFYRDNFNIVLRDYARPDRWWTEKLSLYYDNFRKEGFYPVDVPVSDLQLADVLLMAFQSTHANHCGIYVGNGKLIHHMYRQLSREENLRGAYRNALVAVVRHKDVVIPETAFKPKDLRDDLSPHWRNKINEQAAEV